MINTGFIQQSDEIPPHISLVATELPTHGPDDTPTKTHGPDDTPTS